MILGECKYWKDPVGINILRELEEKSKATSWNKAVRKTWYVLFSSSGFTPELETLAKSARMFYWLAITKIDLCIPFFL